ncbi:MAG TPA: sulfite exporter TauE/SafE family protein [Bacteroidales bacterium]|nr:sulfite exporter TauE/SafE family protein [Bacteroidales bacterium]
MDLSTAVILILLGLAAGILGGLIGVGGGIIIIPGLILLLGMSQHMAQGTSLAVMLPPIGLLAVYNYYKAGEINLKYAAIIATAFLIGGYFGSKIALGIPMDTLRKVFGFFLVLMGLQMAFGR